jgi:GrpB-like predicted nucleotidyltransferase (UPF0157 family)
LPSNPIPPGYDPLKDKIEIVEYDPAWPALYAQEEAGLRQLFGFIPSLKVEHFGSTSVPGLAAKPILDIMVAVESRDLWPSLIEPIKCIGYVYWDSNPKGDEMFFVKGMPPFGEKRTHHLHVYDFQGPRWKKELAFRDHLRSQPEEARRYGILKRELALKFTSDREAYTDAKTVFIQTVLAKIYAG